jgi:hypothetical protein
MADSKVPKFEDTEPLFDDTEPIDEGSETIEKEEPGLLNTLAAKLSQGATLGFDDELAGGLSAAGTALGVKNLGGKMKDVGLTEEGPTLDMDKILAAYRGTRDQTRQTQQEMQDARPITSTVANVAGGLATLPAMPAKMLAPLGAAAPGAALTTRMATGAANAIPTAAVASAGLSNADLTQGEVGQAGKEIAQGTALGAGIGGALPAVGAGLKATGNGLSTFGGKLIPESVKDAYQAGKEGVNIASQEFYDSTTKRLQDLVKFVSDPINKKSNQQTQQALEEISSLEGKLTQINNDVKSSVGSTEARETARVQAELAKRAEDTAALEAKIQAMQEQAKKTVELGEAKAKALNQQDVVKLNQDTVNTAQKLQNQVATVKKALGKKYDELDKAAEATGIVPRNEEVIGNFAQKLSNNSGLPEAEVNNIVKKLVPMHGKTDIQSYRNLKGVLSDYFENANPVVRKTAKEAYANLKNNYANDLRAGNYGQIADDLADTNKRWSSAIELEDQFLSNLKPDRVTGQIEASPDTIRAVGNFADKTPAQMAQSDYLSKLLGTLDPEGAPGAIRQMTGLADDVMATKGFKPDVPMLPDPRITQAQAQLDQMKAMPKPQVEALPTLPNPEIGRLEAILAQAKAKAQGAGKIEGLDLNAANPMALQDELTGLLPKVGMNTGNDIAERKIGQTMDFLKKDQGSQFVDNLTETLKPLNKDVKLRNLVNRGSNEGVPTSLAQAAAAVAGGSVQAANVAGRAVKATQNFLKTGVAKLSDATPEQITQLSAQMAASGGTAGKEYAKVLSESLNKNGQSRNAIMFSLMQQPAFRKLFHEANGTNEVENTNEDAGQ